MKKLIYLLCLLLIALWSCKKDDLVPDDENPGTEKPVEMKNMVTGPSVDAATGTIGLAGGKIAVTAATSPIKGLELDIPGNSFSSEQSFKISYSEIKSHQLGANVNPVSPLIKITTDAGYAQQILRITIPVTYPAGSIPVGFFYDETTGKLEGIPFESITSNSITLLTRHLMPPSKLKSGEVNKSAQAGSGASILISSISESILTGQPVIASGYKPGTDDWEFVNYGSYIASGGHCAGQNMAAMWYYYEKKATEGKLYDRFSEIPNFWQDNVHGYRFCSVIHADLQWDGTVATLFDKYIDKNQELDRLKLMTIAATMLVTGEPQGIGVYQQTGTRPNGTPTYAGHDLICYQVSVNNGKLYISDPNTPGATQEILFSNNKFQPYMAKLNGYDDADPYPFVTYYAKTAYIEWDKIGKRWDELINKTIGTIAPNTFPAYTMEIKGTSLQMKEGLALPKDTLTVNVDCPTAEVAYTIGGKHLIGATAFDKDGRNIDKGTNKYTSTTILKPGKNKVGYYVYGWRSDSKDEDNTYYDQFIDFKWFNVYYMPLTIDPNPLIGEPNTEYKFTAKSKGAAPQQAKYIWNFGDGTSPLTVLNDSTAKHTFAAEGNFTVKVELFDNAANTKIADTTAAATIKVKKLVPVIDSLGTRYNMQYLSGLLAWGCSQMGLANTYISIYGKNYSADAQKTVVKIDGEVVPILNLISVGNGKFEVNKTVITIERPKNKKGMVSVVIESDGGVSQAKNYFIGIPIEYLQTVPVLTSQVNFRINYLDYTNANKLTGESYSLNFYKNMSQIESAVWNGKILTLQGKLVYANISQPTLTKMEYEFSDDGTSVKTVKYEMTSSELDIKFTLNANLALSTQTNSTQFLFVFSRTIIPGSDYNLISATKRRPAQSTPFVVTGLTDGLSTWPNELNLTFSLNK